MPAPWAASPDFGLTYGNEVNDRHCCFLEIVPNERLMWTDVLLPGYRPSGEMGFHDGWGTVTDQLAEYVQTI